MTSFHKMIYTSVFSVFVATSLVGCGGEHDEAKAVDKVQEAEELAKANTPKVEVSEPATIKAGDTATNAAANDSTATDATNNDTQSNEATAEASAADNTTENTTEEKPAENSSQAQ